MRFSPPPRMKLRLDEYSTYHTTRGNEACHFVGIPLIVFGAGGLLARVPLFAVAGYTCTLTELVLLGIATFYLLEARALGLVTALLMVLLGELGRALPFAVGALAFVVGWGVQFLGHAVFEHRSPAFLRNLLHLLVGPAWLVERSSSKKSAGAAEARS